VTVEQREARIVGEEIHFDFLIAAHHDHVLHDAGCRHSREFRKFEAVTVQMDRVNVVASRATTNRPKANVVIQKSLREGFGLVVSETLWKGTPVVAGRAAVRRDTSARALAECVRLSGRDSPIVTRVGRRSAS